jgi:hypothetical protein
MGQYYIPLLIAESGEVATLDPHEYGNGLKLMEHSWIGNDFVNVALSLIKGIRKKIAWIGDYSDDYDGSAYESALPHEEFMEYYKKAWCDGYESNRLSQDRISSEDMSILSRQTEKKGYLVNHDKKQYLNLTRYFDKSVFSYGREGERTWCVNPLPLLTACGNGRGGGDYSDEYPNYDQVGIWAFDTLEYSDKFPEEYERFDVVFKEVE